MKCLTEFFEFGLESNLLYTFGGEPVRLKFMCQKKKRQRQNIKAFRHTTAGLIILHASCKLEGKG